jgi:20S proteasome alpha/beta subunit
MATEKKLPPLMDDTSIQKISLLTDNIGVVYAGMGPDSRVLVRKGRKIAQQYFRTYHAPIPVNQLVRELAAIMQEFTQSGYVPRLCSSSTIFEPVAHTRAMPSSRARGRSLCSLAAMQWCATLRCLPPYRRL